MSPGTPRGVRQQVPSRSRRLQASALMTAGWLVSQLGDVLVPLPGGEAAGCGANPLDGVLHVQVPQPDRVVGVAAGQGVPVGAERHRIGGGGAAGQGLAEQLRVRGIGDIPQPDRAVGVAAGQRVPVGAERYGVGGGRAGLRLAERAGVRGIGDIPQLDRAVGAGRRQRAGLRGALLRQASPGVSGRQAPALPDGRRPVTPRRSAMSWVALASTGLLSGPGGWCGRLVGQGLVPPAALPTRPDALPRQWRSRPRTRLSERSITHLAAWCPRR